MNIATGVAREREQVLVDFVETLPEDDILRTELGRLPRGAHRGLVGELPLLRGAALLRLARRGGPAARRRSEAECGVSHIRSTTALRVPAQIIPLSKLNPERMDPRLGDVDAERSRPPRA